MSRLMICACALWLATATDASAQQRVSGTWLVEYDMRLEREGDGAERVTERGKARLELSQRGDSLFGIWQGSTGPSRTERPVRGTVEGGNVRFTTGVAEATISRNGAETKLQIVSEFSGAVDGDIIGGTMTVRPLSGPEMPAGRRRTWDGRRQLTP
jgi:hypothetical protein